ncbi:MAG: DUF3040 domain-containing protein [Propionibacteriaceae bacterium]|nr:DUF3040 domain-containing protein [Propionibacteriaceae bacterium]
MALSEQEQRRLEQLEASLMADDPGLADTLRGVPQFRVQKRRATLAALGILAGLTALVVGIQIHPAISVAGFVLMLVSAIMGMSAWTRIVEDGVPAGEPRPPRPTRQPSHSDFMEKLEERWRRRQQGEDL